MGRGAIVSGDGMLGWEGWGAGVSGKEEVALYPGSSLQKTVGGEPGYEATGEVYTNYPDIHVPHRSRTVLPTSVPAVAPPFLTWM